MPPLCCHRNVFVLSTRLSVKTTSLAAQATFAASPPCMANTGPVFELMGQVTPSQRWGMGVLNTTIALKGGARGQMADISCGKWVSSALPTVHESGSLGARPADGRFDTGVSDLGEVARWVFANIHTGGQSQC